MKAQSDGRPRIGEYMPSKNPDLSRLVRYPLHKMVRGYEQGKEVHNVTAALRQTHKVGRGTPSHNVGRGTQTHKVGRTWDAVPQLGTWDAVPQSGTWDVGRWTPSHKVGRGTWDRPWASNGGFVTAWRAQSGTAWRTRPIKTRVCNETSIKMGSKGVRKTSSPREYCASVYEGGACVVA